MSDIEWVAVPDRTGRLIGAVGFLDDKAVAIVSFFDDKDADKNGKVSPTEWTAFKLSPIAMKGKAIAEVAMQGRHVPGIYERDSDYRSYSANIFVSFGARMAVSGVYAAYFAYGVSMVGSALATRITSGMAKELVIRKGFEAIVKKVVLGAAGVS